MLPMNDAVADQLRHMLRLKTDDPIPNHVAAMYDRMKRHSDRIGGIPFDNPVTLTLLVILAEGPNVPAKVEVVDSEADESLSYKPCTVMWKGKARDALYMCALPGGKHRIRFLEDDEVKAVTGDKITGM